MFKHKYHSVIPQMTFWVTQRCGCQGKSLVNRGSFETFWRCKAVDNPFWSTNFIISRTIIKLSLGYTHIWFGIAAKRRNFVHLHSLMICVMIISNSKLRGLAMQKLKQFEVLVMYSLFFLVWWLKRKGRPVLLMKVGVFLGIYHFLELPVLQPACECN